MFKKSSLLIVSILPAFFTVVPSTTSAVEFSGAVWASWEIDQLEHIYLDTKYSDALEFTGTYQPRSGKGLVGVSASVDIQHSSGATGNASVAVYGTDSTRSNVGSLDPGLIASGIGVEPMIDIQASASSGVYDINTGPGAISPVIKQTDGNGTAEASIKVQHRVILNPEVAISDAILGDVLNQLNSVPLQVLWAYDVSGFGRASVNFDMSVTSTTGDCASGVGGRCGGFQFLDVLPSSSNSGSMPFTAVASRTGRVATYDIAVHAFGGATTFVGDPVSSELQAVIDPLLTLDPSWEYAQYFKVQQESTLNPGEWVGITRNYLGTSAVPVPPAVWLFGSGLIGLVGIARRKERI